MQVIFIALLLQNTKHVPKQCKNRQGSDGKRILYVYKQSPVHHLPQKTSAITQAGPPKNSLVSSMYDELSTN